MSSTGRDGSNGGICAEQWPSLSVADTQSILTLTHTQVEGGGGKQHLLDTSYMSGLVLGNGETEIKHESQA